MPTRTFSSRIPDEEPGGMVAATALPLRTRILLVDDHGLVRAGLRRLLESRADFEVVGEAADGEEAVARAVEQSPDLVLMDLVMPKLGGIEATRRIVALRRGIRVLVISQLASESAVEEALRAGANGYLLKSAAPDDLLRAVEAVSRGSAYFSPGVARSIGRVSDATRAEDPSTACLSPREREILTRLAEGHSSGEIAATLHISPRTVDTHRVRLMKKLGLHKAPHLVRFAIRAQPAVDEVLEAGDHLFEFELAVLVGHDERQRVERLGSDGVSELLGRLGPLRIDADVAGVDGLDDYARLRIAQSVQRVEAGGDLSCVLVEVGHAILLRWRATNR